MTNVILTFNAGSTSLKFTVFAVVDGKIDTKALATGTADDLGDNPHLRIVARAGGGIDTSLSADAGHEQVLHRVLDWIEAHEAGLTVVAVGHRIVHGGTAFYRPCRVDADVLTALTALIPLAPLHQPHNLSPVRLLAKSHPDLPQIACFDTGFHASNDPLVSHYALPRDLTDTGIRRYGFHGLSYEYIASTLPDFLGTRAEGRVVVAHLGGGASMCALRGRRSVASTMGFSALDGVPMGTRSGAMDPGVLLYLMQEKGMDYAALTDLFYHRSGLFGVSAESGDMQALLASSRPEAKEAIDMFVYRVGRELGSLAAALGGLDAFVFTGGIGEHAAPVRAGICQGAEWLGVRLDDAANATDGPRISKKDSPVSVFVIPTDEDLMIARHTLGILSGKKIAALRPETQEERT